MKNFIWIILIFFAGSALAEELYFFGGGFSRISRKSDTFDFSRLDSDLTAKESISSEKANFIAGWRPDWDLSVLSPEFRGLVTKHSLTSSSYYAEIIGIGPELRINAWGGIHGYAGYNFNFIDDLIVFKNHFHFYDDNRRYGGYITTSTGATPSLLNQGKSHPSASNFPMKSTPTAFLSTTAKPSDYPKTGTDLSPTILFSISPSIEI